MRPISGLKAIPGLLFFSIMLLACSGNAEFKTDVVIQHLNSPWAFVFLPDGAVLITLKGGAMLRADLNTGKQYRVSGLPESTQIGQGGLLDVELHPEFARNKWLYLSFTRKVPGGYTTALARAQLKADTLTNSEILFTAKAVGSGGRHFGSRLAFDHQGYLYMSIGDRGERHYAQDLSRHNGKIIRLHEDGRIPEDNPFLGLKGALPEIYSYGHRNPQGMVFDHQHKRLWIHEHGPKGGDELNWIRAGSNYGWPLVTYGREYSGGKISDKTEMAGVESPAFYWDPSIAPSGMTIYQGNQFPDWQGDILIGALKYQLVARIRMDGTRAVGEYRFLQRGERIRDVKSGPDAAIYVLTDGPDAQLWRLTSEYR